MQAKKFPIWGVFLIAFLAIQLFERGMLPLIMTGATVLGLPEFAQILLRLLLPFIVFSEIVGKFLILQSIRPPKFGPTKVEDWPHVNLDALAYYTEALQKLGFTPLGDYTAPTIKGMMRLFVHPELACFAEVGQLQGQQIFCSMSSELNEEWIMTTTNLDSSPSALAVGYAFMRLPRKIHRRLLKATPDVLLNTLVTWRSQVSQDLAIEPLDSPSAQMYFAASERTFLKLRHRLWCSSIIWRELEILFYWLNPKSDWLGEYPKLKQRLAQAA